MSAKTPEAGFVKQFYDSQKEVVADTYEHVRWQADEARRRDYDQTAAIVREVLSRHCPGGAAIEVGCGPGTWTQVLREFFDVIRAVDISQQMLTSARARITDSKVTFVCADFQNADQSGVFDVLFSSRAIEYMDKSTAVKTINRMLKSGGTAVIITKNPVFLYRWADLLGKRLAGKRPDRLHDDQIAYSRLRELFRSNGFDEVRVYPAVFDVYLPLSRFAAIRNVQLLLSRVLWERWGLRPMRRFLMPVTESYVLVARKSESDTRL